MIIVCKYFSLLCKSKHFNLDILNNNTFQNLTDGKSKLGFQKKKIIAGQQISKTDSQ